MVTIKKRDVIDKILDCVSILWLLLSIKVRKITQIFTFKPYYIDYIKTKLGNRFSTKKIYSDRDGDKLNFYVEIPGGLTKIDMLNTAKMFGLTLRNVQFIKTSDSYWKITFLPKGVLGIKSLIQSFPNWIQQVHTGKTVLDFEPNEEVYLTHDQKLRLHKEGKKTWSVIIDILDYLFSIPILRDVLRQIYWHRDKLSKIRDKIPKNEYDIRMYLIAFTGVIIFCLFMYTFTFWATIFCLLLAGYAIRRIRKSIKVKIIP
jgi:hypothetical protein